ncbi:acetaldehyde dehydrogenase (acetylating) [Azoarcus sp. TTM-91]|uniref:acetaldehyde dehydrogenase (acetylating) n=1 Tax=Azoarcus sp. TTM-91 TaxID=2691581 RepID=UPI00145EE141|nr:acetaldehyde dehydrogenase (acetylating) [Azoarcus sp. TTM-91]NMG34214.1 acetaldehyde dehydrogenase (acetylating) [Azoarcus sp. TTM-91]
MSSIISRLRCAVLGAGLAGTDLLYKLNRSVHLDARWMIDIHPTAAGLAQAREFGLRTVAGTLADALPQLIEDRVRLVFDASGGARHPEHAQQLEQAGIRVIDLTPAANGPLCMPAANLEQVLRTAPRSICLVGGGAQAVVPLVRAMTNIQPLAYGEVAVTAPATTCGPACLGNVDEMTHHTARAMERVGGARQGKAILLFSPGQPQPLRASLRCLTEDLAEETALFTAVKAVVSRLQRELPGYRLARAPRFQARQVDLEVEIEGLGDSMPPYAANLDLLSLAALRCGEALAGARS